MMAKNPQKWLSMAQFALTPSRMHQNTTQNLQIAVREMSIISITFKIKLFREPPKKNFKIKKLLESE